VRFGRFQIILNIMIESNSLTTREVARLCRVSPATVKRWEDAGLLTSERTSGGHRRFRAEEVARFQREKNLGVKRNPGDESVTKAKTRRRADKNLSECSFFHSLISGCEEEASDRLINDYLNGTPLTKIFDNLIAGTMTKIGELWYQGKLTVAQEHLATRSILSALHKLRNSVPIPNPCNKLGICFAVEGDFHELPAHLAQMTLESEGWDVMNFGANTPFFSIADEIIQHSPQIVCISSTVIENIERTSHDYKVFCEKISKQNTKLLLGGRVFQDNNIRNRFPAQSYPKSFTEVSEIARQFIQ
jgi:excisionase family DNA binding protein